MLLAIDTATQVTSLALHDGRSLLAEHTWHSANNHTIELAPAIQNTLTQCNVAVDQLTALAVSVGPGSYTGLRIGVSFAKGLAAAHSLPLVGLSTLDITAAAQPYYQGQGLIVVVQAGRGRIIVGTYRWRKGRWDERGQPHIMDWETLLNSIDGPACVTGEINGEGIGTLLAAQEKGVPVTIVPAAHRLRRAGFLAEEAWTLYNANPKGYRALEVKPIYVQPADAS